MVITWQPKRQNNNDLSEWDLIDTQHAFVLALLDNVRSAVFLYILPQNNFINLQAVLNPKIFILQCNITYYSKVVAYIYRKNLRPPI